MDKIEELKDENKIEELIDLLQNGDRKEREDAAKTLGMIGSEDSIHALEERLRYDERATVRANAALALGQIDGRGVEDILKEGIEDDDWEVRHDTAIAMGNLGKEEFVEDLLELTEDPESEVKKKAVEALGEIGDEDIILEIENFLEDEALKVETAKAISKLGTEETVQTLIDMYYQGGQEIREIAIEGLDDIECEEATDLLIEALKDSSWRIREDATTYLKERDEDKVVEPLLERLEDEKSYVVEEVLRSLGSFEDESLLEEIEEKTRSDEPGVRIAAAEALEKIDSMKSAEYLIEALERENNPRVLWSVSESLSEISKTILEDLENKINTVSGDKKLFLSIAMTKAGFSDHVEEVISALDADGWKMRQKAAEALGGIELKDMNKRSRKRSLNMLRDRLKDNDKWVRAKAVRTLADLLAEYDGEIDTKKYENEISDRKEGEIDEDVMESLDYAEDVLDI